PPPDPRYPRGLDRETVRSDTRASTPAGGRLAAVGPDPVRTDRDRRSAVTARAPVSWGPAIGTVARGAPYAASFTLSPTRRARRSSISTHEGSNSKRPMLNLGLEG